MNMDMEMFQQTFCEEAADLLEDLEARLLQLEASPDDPELLNTIFRCAHSLKGGSATFGFGDIAHFTHGLETLLDLLRGGQMRVTRPLLNLLLESQDQLKALLAVARKHADEAPDSAPLVARIEAAIRGEGIAGAPADEVKAEAAGMTPTISGLNAAPAASQTSGCADSDKEGALYTLRLVPGPDVLRQGSDLIRLLTQLRGAGEVRSTVCDLSRLPPLAAMDSETCYLAWNITLHSHWEPEQILDIFEFIADESEITLSREQGTGNREQEEEENRRKGEEDTGTAQTSAASAFAAGSAPAAEAAALLPTLSVDANPPMAAVSAPMPAASVAAAAAPVARPAETQTLRVATDKVDKLINLVGELVINQSMLNEAVQNFSMAKLPRLMEAVGQMERASRELQERVMAVRMLPIKNAFGRFPRLVHDLSAACGKKIELKTTGEDTELDKTVIESIADPLTHLIRNSVDHGMETPDERRALGKPETGTVALNAFHEGGSIIIEVTDDGRGLNRERILNKAYERGLLSSAEPVPADDTIYNFIFHPGFSTAAAVTDVSGRGVGMDIVKQGVQALGGTITLTTTPGVGTRFRVRLPLTLAILEGLSLSVGDEIYILPLTSIVESIRPRREDVRQIAGRSEVVIVRDETLPLLRLYQVFGAMPRYTDPVKGLLVIVENDGHKVALLVDELIGQSQAVIKSLESNYHKVEGIAGATIMGDGRVALIVDVAGLTRQAHDNTRAVAA